MIILEFLALLGAGIVFIVYAYQVVRIFGHLSWAERFLGPGGSYAAWRLIGVVLIIGSFWLLAHG